MTDQAQPEVDHVLADGKWEFDAEVTAVFDNMLERSIPQYATMRRASTAVAHHFMDKWPQPRLVDLGTSRGEAMAPLVDKWGAKARFLGVEISEPMLEAARERFEGYISSGVVELRQHDLREGHPSHAPAAVIQSVLTLQFTPIEYRQRIVQDVYDNLLEGGAFILVEKVLGSTARLDRLMVDTYLGMKREAGYSADEIERKRLSLEGVLVPVTARWNEELLHMAGFREVDCYWRWQNFAAWVALK